MRVAIRLLPQRLGKQASKVAHVLVVGIHLEVEPTEVLLERKHVLRGHPVVRARQYPELVGRGPVLLGLRSLMVFFAGLVGVEGGPVLVVADEAVLEALAPLDRVRDRGSADQQPVALDAVESLELLELRDKGVLVRLCHLGPELEEYCALLVRKKGLPEIDAGRSNRSYQRERLSFSRPTEQ